jgi:hypothetical protein
MPDHARFCIDTTRIRGHSRRMLFTSLLLVLACATADKADSGKPATEPGTVELGGVCPIGEKVGGV